MSALLSYISNALNQFQILIRTFMPCRLLTLNILVPNCCFFHAPTDRLSLTFKPPYMGQYHWVCERWNVKYNSVPSSVCQCVTNWFFYLLTYRRPSLMSIIVQQDANIYSFIIFLQTALHVSGDNLIHPLLWRSRSDSSTTPDGSKYGSTSARCCNYSSRVLLMMDEVITRNM